MIILNDYCLYAAFGKPVQAKGCFQIHRSLTNCADKFSDAKRKGESFIILFADASVDSSRLVSWSLVSGIRLDGGKTIVEFRPVKPLTKKVRVSFLRKATNNRPISEAIRRGQILCHTPGFLKRIMPRVMNSDRAKKKLDVKITLPPPDKTEKDALIKSRLGQGRYRTGVRAVWKDRCAVTGMRNVCLLHASHIKPWKDSTNKEKLDGYNGLLLTPNLDKAFDRGLIAFDDHGRILLSTRLPRKDAKILGIGMESKLSNVPAEMARYLRYHRRYVFKS